jgi:hypothetical protein
MKSAIIIVLLAIIAGAVIWPQLDHRSDLEKATANVEQSIKRFNGR